MEKKRDERQKNFELTALQCLLLICSALITMDNISKYLRFALAYQIIMLLLKIPKYIWGDKK